MTADCPRCSFCGRTQEEVAKLIAGPEPVFICSDCVALCVDICLSAPVEGKPFDKPDKKRFDS